MLDVTVTEVTENAMLLVLNLYSFGISRKLRSDAVAKEHGGKEKRFRSQKTILESREVDDIKSFDGFTKKFINNLCLPFELPGFRMIPNSSVAEAEEYLMVRLDKREELIGKMLDAYPDLKAKDKIDLGDAFKEHDYPSVAQVREEYSMRWRFLTFTTPGNLKQLNRALWERERERSAKMWADNAKLADAFLHGTMSKIVNHMIDKITGKGDGKKWVFYSSTIDNVNQFLKTFDPRNINNNGELSELAKRLKDAMEGVDVDDIKKRKNVREHIELEFSKVKRHLDSMIIARPTRMIDLDDDDTGDTEAQAPELIGA